MQMTLKSKLLIGISGLILLLVTVMTFNSYQKTKEIIIAQEENHFAVLENIVGVEIDNYLSRGELLVKFVAEDQEAIKAFAGRERHDLAMMVQGRYDSMQDEGVNVLQFHLPDGTSFYRAHQPEKYGDSVMFRDTIKTIFKRKSLLKL
jgi:methyl-accepting chemotaxis protein